SRREHKAMATHLFHSLQKRIRDYPLGFHLFQRNRRLKSHRISGFPWHSSFIVAKVQTIYAPSSVAQKLSSVLFSRGRICLGPGYALAVKSYSLESSVLTLDL